MGRPRQSGYAGNTDKMSQCQNPPAFFNEFDAISLIDKILIGIFYSQANGFYVVLNC